MALALNVLYALLMINFVRAEPLPLIAPKTPNSVFDIQGHRGGRSHTVENTLPGFAWGLINGVSTLELDNGITKDGHVVVWHDEDIQAAKCKDTGAVIENDPLYPYVGKFVANLTLAQVKTLDCGSIRQTNYQLQILYPHTRIATLEEFFSFMQCADPRHTMKFNIESKVDALSRNQTVGPSEFVQRQHAVFEKTPYHRIAGAITYQSFDWRTLVRMRKLDPTITLSALVDGNTIQNASANEPSKWLAGVDPFSFPGPSLDEQIAQAAHSIGASVLSPATLAPSSKNMNPKDEGFVEFASKLMVDEAHRLGILVKPWTANGLDIIERLALEYKVDGIITDQPHDVRRWAKYEAKIPVSPKYARTAVFKCLADHLQTDSTNYLERPPYLNS